MTSFDLTECSRVTYSAPRRYMFLFVGVFMLATVLLGVGKLWQDFLRGDPLVWYLLWMMLFVGGLSISCLYACVVQAAPGAIALEVDEKGLTLRYPSGRIYRREWTSHRIGLSIDIRLWREGNAYVMTLLWYTPCVLTKEACEALVKGAQEHQLRVKQHTKNIRYGPFTHVSITS
jgi:hypothetical protein